MKLIIGTANFLKPYGIKKKIIKKKNLKNIFKYSFKKKIYYFDCSENYGNLKFINEYFFKQTKIFYKIKVENIKKKILFEEMQNIKKYIYCIMIHNIDHSSIKKLKKNYLDLKNITEDFANIKIGISIYDIKDLNLIKRSNLNFDYIQIPLNIFNNTFNSGNTKELRLKGVKFIARSVFLQGILLRDVSSKLIKNKLNLKILKLNKFLDKYKISSLDICLDFIKKQKWLNKCIVGIDDEIQLKKIIEKINSKKKINHNYKFFTNEKKIIDPRFWN